jgi:hypothetical protein
VKKRRNYPKKQKEDRRVERERLKVRREREKERKAAERAELQRKEQEVKEATAAQKAVQLSQRGKRPGQRQRKRGLRTRLKVVVEVVSLHLPYLQNAPKHAVSTFQLDIQISRNNRKALFTTIPQISRDNTYCGWLYSLVFVGVHMMFGGASRRSGRVTDSYVRCTVTGTKN